MSRPNCWEIRGAHIALVAGYVHPQVFENKVQGGRSGVSSGVGGSKGTFRTLELFKTTEGGFSRRLRDRLRRSNGIE